MAAVLDPLLDWADNEWDSMSEKEKAEWEQSADADNAILFLPFPFTTKEVQQPPYKGSDPEWSTFLALSKDQQLQKEIKRQSSLFHRHRHHHHPLPRPPCLAHPGLPVEPCADTSGYQSASRKSSDAELREIQPMSNFSGEVKSS